MAIYRRIRRIEVDVQAQGGQRLANSKNIRKHWLPPRALAGVIEAKQTLRARTHSGGEIDACRGDAA